MARPVGIIANPFSGTDIRRIVSHASSSDNLHKVQMLQCVLVGLVEAGVREVLYLPDPSNLVPAAYWALRNALREKLAIRPVLNECRGERRETSLATAAMVREGVGAIVTLGGDGTVRLVAKTARGVPLMPLPAGTNNVFPICTEPTVAGLAAGAVAVGGDTSGCHRAKLCRVFVGDNFDLALIDVALLDASFTGSRAIWEPASLRALVVSQGLRHMVGLSAIAGQVCPVGLEEPAGAYIRFGPGRMVRALIAPGQFADVSVAEARRIPCGTVVELGRGPGVLACDGERIGVVATHVPVTVEVSLDGPLVIDPAVVLQR